VQADLRGGHPVLDFINTVAWRGDPARRIDRLAGYSDLVAWCRRVGLVSAAETRALTRTDGRAAHRTLTEAKRLREALHTVCTARTLSPRDRETIGDAYLRAMRRRELRLAGDHLVWAERSLTVQAVVDRIALEAVDLLSAGALPRIKRCDDAACGWLFLDTSHRQNRRWCSAADCGNRDRARRHYERTRR
jgi:predicted RNA-binding Zn ribbon-like protein